jgi:TPP-dependent indolepyruvate ferredoxin oxidoreductase alpha subunit
VLGEEMRKLTEQA